MSFDLKKYIQDNPLLKEDEIEFTDQEWNPKTRSLSSTVKYKPDFKKAFDDLEDAKDSIEAIASKDELMNDKQIKRIKDLVKDAFNKYRSHLRNNYSDEYKKIKSRGNMEETSVSGDAYDTPYAFSKNKNRKYKPVNQGFTTVNSKQLRKKAKGTDYIDLM